MVQPGQTSLLFWFCLFPASWGLSSVKSFCSCTLARAWTLDLALDLILTPEFQELNYSGQVKPLANVLPFMSSWPLSSVRCLSLSIDWVFHVYSTDCTIQDKRRVAKITSPVFKNASLVCTALPLSTTWLLFTFSTNHWSNSSLTTDQTDNLTFNVCLAAAQSD